MKNTHTEQIEEVKRAITCLPADDAQRTVDAVNIIRAAARMAGVPGGDLALALCGMEAQQDFEDAAEQTKGGFDGADMSDAQDEPDEASDRSPDAPVDPSLN